MTAEGDIARRPSIWSCVTRSALPWPQVTRIPSKPADWTPLQHYKNAFAGHNNPSIDRSDPWQFKNFLITEGD